jgi:hypothetical protein
MNIDEVKDLKWKTEMFCLEIVKRLKEEQNFDDQCWLKDFKDSVFMYLRELDDIEKEKLGLKSFYPEWKGKMEHYKG